MSQQFDVLVKGVQRTQKLQIRRWLVLGLCVVIGLWFVCFLSYLALDLKLKLSVPGRLVVFLGTVTLLLTAGWRMIVRPFLSRRADESVAAEIEAQHPEVETTLSTSIEYGESPEKTEALSSPEIVNRLIDQASERVQSIHFEESVDWRLPKGLTLAVLLIALGVVWGFQYAPTLFWPAFLRLTNPLAEIDPPTLAKVVSVTPGTNEVPFRANVEVQAVVNGFQPDVVQLNYRSFGKDWRSEEMPMGDDGRYSFSFRNVKEDFEYYVKARDDISEHYDISVFVEPAIEKLSVLLTYPEYTGMAPVRIDRKVAGLRALEGTKVQFQARTNVPVREGQILFKDMENVQFDLAEPQLLKGSFVINADDHYAIKLRDLKGRSNSGLLWQSIKALKDQSPTVRITHPDPDLMVHEEQEVKIRMNAEDDFGVTELGLAFYVLGEDEMRETVKTLESPLRKTRGRTVFDLGRMILPSGAIIAYYAYGKDNDTVNGPKEGVSVLHFIRVYEEEELADQDSMQSEQQRQAEQSRQQMLANLEKIVGDQIKVTATTFKIAKSSNKRSTQERQAMDSMAKLERKLTGQVEALADNLESALDQFGEDEKPEVSELREALTPMRDAGWLLNYHAPTEALDPEKNAIHHLSQARRLIKSMSNQPSRQQAYMAVMQNQKNSKKQNQQNRQQQMQEMAKDMPKMLERQEKVKRELEQLAKKEEKERQRDETYQPDDWQSYQKRREISDELREQLNDAFEMARRMADENDKENKALKRAEERIKDAANETYQSQRALAYRQYKTALEKSREAEQKMREAERSLHNAMRRDMAQAMESAAERAEELAQQQATLQQDTERQDGAESQQSSQQQSPQQSSQQQSSQQQSSQQQSQQQSSQQAQSQSSQQAQSRSQSSQQSQQQAQAQSQQGQQSQQARAQSEQQSQQSGSRSGEEQQQAHARQGSQQQESSRQSASGEQKENQQQQGGGGEQKENEQKKQQQSSSPTWPALAQRQRQLEAEAKSLAEELEDLAARAAQGGRTQDQQDLEKAATDLKEGETAQELQQAAEDIEAGKLSSAVGHQEEAKKGLKRVRSQLASAVARSRGEDDEKLRKMLEQTEKLAQEQRTLNRQAARGGEPSELAPKQSALSKKTKDLGGEARKSTPLADAGLEEETNKAYNEAAKRMTENQKAIENNAEAYNPSHGEEAVRQLETAAEHLRLARERSLGNRLAQAASMAKAAAEQQRRVEDSLKTTAEETPEGKNIPQWNRRTMTRTQKDAANTAKELEKNLSLLSKAAEKTGEWVGKDIDQVRSQIKEDDLVPRMDKLSKNLSSSKAMNRSQARAQEASAGEIADELDKVHERLAEAHKNYLATPLERLQTAKKDVSEAIQKLQQLKADAARKGKTDPQLPAQIQMMEQTLERLADQMNRSGARSQSEQQNLQQAKQAVSSARKAISARETEKASGEFTAARDHLQIAREGILERIKRILRKRDIKEPGSEHVPDEYRDLVKRYYRVLSEEK